MAQTINTNIGSLTVRRNMDKSQNDLATSLRRLSSGLRIQSAADDAAGLAISDRMTAKVRGMNQAARNVNDGISMLQVAEGALSGINENLQRIRQLAVQASNATTSASDKAALQQEVAQLISEVDRVGSSTQFNGMNVFNSSTESAVGDPTQLAVIEGLQNRWLENAEQMISSAYGISGNGAALQIRLSGFTDGAGGTAAYVSFQVDGNGYGTNLTLQVDMADFTPANPPDGGSAPFYNDRIIAHEMVHALMANTMAIGGLPTWFLEGAAELIHGADERVAGDLAAAGGNAMALIGAAFGAGFDGTSAAYSGAYAATRYMHDQIQAAGGNGVQDVMQYLSTNANSTLDQALSDLATTLGGPVAGWTSAADFVSEFVFTAGTGYIAGMDLANADTGAIGGLDADGGAIKTASSVVANSGTRTGTDVLTGFAENFEAVATGTGARTTLAMQAGADANQTIDASVGAANAMALGITGADLTTDASAVIAQMDRAMAYVNGERTKLGAQMNRLGASIENLGVTSENLAASRSRITDADFAAETSALSRSQVLQQAATAMLAQANVSGRDVLTLLR